MLPGQIFLQSDLCEIDCGGIAELNFEFRRIVKTESGGDRAAGKRP